MTFPPRVPFPGVAALRRRRLTRRLGIIALLLGVLVGIALLWPAPQRGALAVPTASTAAAPTGVAIGVLAGTRSGDRACFTVATATGAVALVLPSGWSASADLDLLDPAGVVATAGERVVVTGTPGAVARLPGCPTARVWTVSALRLQR